MVLKEYEDAEFYEECAIIKKALDEYNNTKVKDKIDEHIIFPTSLSVYRGNKFQKVLNQYNIVVEDKHAIEKATLIKLNLPVKNGL